MAWLAPRGTIRRKVFQGLLATLLAIIVAVMVVAGYSVYHVVYVVIPHSYAAWTAGDLLVEYMDTHDGKWPHGWADLHEATSYTNHGLLYWDFAKLSGMEKIDWNANPEALGKLAMAVGPSAVKVVTQLDGSTLETKWGGDTEPNQKVGRYLIKRYSTNGAAKAETAPK